MLLSTVGVKIIGAILTIMPSNTKPMWKQAQFGIITAAYCPLPLVVALLFTSLVLLSSSSAIHLISTAF